MGLLKIVAVILVIVAVVAAGVYLMGQFEQTRPIHDQIMGYVDTAKTWLTENWAITSASIGGLVTVGGAAYSKLSQAKNELTQLKDSATSQISSLTSEKDKLAATITGYEEQAKTTALGYESQITDLKKQVEAATIDSTEISKLKAQVSSVEKQNSDFVNSLLKAANGAVVVNPIDGKTYSVLKLPQETLTVVK